MSDEYRPYPGDRTHIGADEGVTGSAASPAPEPAPTERPAPAEEPLTSMAPEEPLASRSQSRGTGRAVLAAVLGGIIGGLLVAAVFTWVIPPRTETAELSPAPAAVVASDTVEDQPIETVAADVVPSVVNVAITQNSGFFGPVSGNGSGVILTRDGFILTNNHVVEGATSIDVQIGTRDLPAKVVGTDPSSDLAVIKVDATGLTPARIGNSAALKVGQGVVAVGSPFGLDKTVTQGIVSALHRSDLNTGVAAYTNLIQTDAPINPGNSGGGLFDLQGNVVGINALIDTGNSGAAQSAGIGFSIPIDYANFIARQIIAGKKVQHPYLGVGTVDVTPPLASQNHLAVSSGALVQMVAQNSPAARAGIKDGDIIVSMGAQGITTSDEVVAAVRNARIGERLRIVLVRGTAHITVTATMGSV